MSGHRFRLELGPDLDDLASRDRPPGRQSDGAERAECREPRSDPDRRGEAVDEGLRRGVAAGTGEKMAGALVPYFSVHCTFDARRARDLLGATPPPLRDYFPSLMRYAREARWGKAPAPRWDVGMQQRAA